MGTAASGLETAYPHCVFPVWEVINNSNWVSKECNVSPMNAWTLSQSRTGTGAGAGTGAATAADGVSCGKARLMCHTACATSVSNSDSAPSLSRCPSIPRREYRLRSFILLTSDATLRNFLTASLSYTLNIYFLNTTSITGAALSENHLTDSSIFCTILASICPTIVFTSSKNLL
jgi:hypothetical protein